MMSKVIFFFGMLVVGQMAYGQAFNPTGKAWDETSTPPIVLNTGTSIVADVTADKGNAIFRPASAGRATMWYGPYVPMQAGNYLLQFRLKVSSNVSTSGICVIDVSSLTGGIAANSLMISPSMFRASNEWQLFTIPVQVAGNTDNIEMRGLDFIPGIADLYLDYINVVPGDIRGFYSNELTIDAKGNVLINGMTKIKSQNISYPLIGGRNPLYLDADNFGSSNSSAIVFSKGNTSVAEIATDIGTAGNKDIYVIAGGGNAPILLNPYGGTGNVGIGTLTPTQKLAVNGTVLAKKVKVSQSATDWPDYVFDSSYQLPSLDSVSTFIQTNKHLPDMPSAAAVEKDGHDLGEVQKLLLKKVEEMTLYMIEQNKKIANQDKEIAELKQLLKYEHKKK